MKYVVFWLLLDHGGVYSMQSVAEPSICWVLSLLSTRHRDKQRPLTGQCGAAQKLCGVQPS